MTDIIEDVVAKGEMEDVLDRLKRHSKTHPDSSIVAEAIFEIENLRAALEMFSAEFQRIEREDAASGKWHITESM